MEQADLLQSKHPYEVLYRIKGHKIIKITKLMVLSMGDRDLGNADDKLRLRLYVGNYEGKKLQHVEVYNEPIKPREKAKVLSDIRIIIKDFDVVHAIVSSDSHVALHAHRVRLFFEMSLIDDTVGVY